MYKIKEINWFTYWICDDMCLSNLIFYKEFYWCWYVKWFFPKYKNTTQWDWWCVVLDKTSKELREKIRRTVELSYKKGLTI